MELAKEMLENKQISVDINNIDKHNEHWPSRAWRKLNLDGDSFATYFLESSKTLIHFFDLFKANETHISLCFSNNFYAFGASKGVFVIKLGIRTKKANRRLTSIFSDCKTLFMLNDESKVDELRSRVQFEHNKIEDATNVWKDFLPKMSGPMQKFLKQTVNNSGRTQKIISLAIQARVLYLAITKQSPNELCSDKDPSLSVIEEVESAPVMEDRKGDVFSLIEDVIIIDEVSIHAASRSTSECNYGTVMKVSFLRNFNPVIVKTVSTDDESLDLILAELVDQEPMTLFLSYDRTEPDDLVSCYQICSSKCVCVIRDTNAEPNDILRDFLSRNSNNRFVSMSCSDYFERLSKRYGPEFRIYLEDVAVTRLGPHRHSLKFDEMTELFVGPANAEFVLRKEMCPSYWDPYYLTKEQVLYLGYMAVALHKAMKNLPDVYTDPYNQD